ncbi:MAG: ABC-F family ATP-binding cassette domain-containing protein [Clostridia bacterium]|nr:ABC-F family ATP-binding cassette domain-containing protein [Clostridia bacterium]
MGQIKVTGLSFRYDGSFENLFENVSFTVDTDWRLGFIGRNGKGKTTFLKLLLGLYPYSGTISANTGFSYFPLTFGEDELDLTGWELLAARFPDREPWRVIRELACLGEGEELLQKKLGLNSLGQRAKFELAVLFSKENEFLLIDEPTNHLDAAAREKVKDYLASRSGFILVSHDRDFLDSCVDHILSLNKKNIDVQKGNYSVWWENKQRRDAFAEAENEKHEKQIRSLRDSARRMADWADKSESAKIGVSRSENRDRPANARTYIGSKTKKMQKRAAAAENRIEREIEQKEALLDDVEFVMDLKLSPLEYRKEVLFECADYTFRYAGAEQPALRHLSFDLRRGDRVLLSGANGCGKSTLLKRILLGTGAAPSEPFAFEESGVFRVGSGLTVSYVSQDTSSLRGSVPDFCAAAGIDRSRFCTILYQMGLRRAQFEKDLSEFSDGQKKKALTAASLCASAHLYIWDEPLNFIDIFSREQIENLILKYRPTMIFAEHDKRFEDRIATKIVEM